MDPAPNTVDTSSPYVGLRPFEAYERDRFHGRERDAQILTDKILSASITILYAQSGLGKSSLLRTLVVPAIEEDAIVVYFDEWAQEDPTRALKEVLAKAVTRLGIPDADRGSPTLTELARLVENVAERDLVIVLDQFEEFLVTHGRQLDPLRTELAALVRAADVDVQVVLCLREEFLAALEPIRNVILDLFKSTYRLEPLTEAGVRAAISKPPEAAGGTCEEALADRLVKDLAAQDVTEAVGAAAVDLPMLQLVCRQLWAKAQQEGHRNLTLDLYERMGGANRIIDEYVRSVMPSRRADRVFTAELMTLLAPPSGLKMSYSVEDLAKLTQLDAGRIEAELERLSKARILRTRDYRAGQRYELQHDAFIRVIAPWRDEVLQRARRRRLMAWVSVSALVLLLLGWGVVGYRFQQEQDDLRLAKAESERDKVKAESTLARERAAAQQRETEEKERWLTGGLVAELRSMPEDMRKQLAPSRFDAVVQYVLWNTKGEERLDALKALLVDHADLLPLLYGLNTSGLNFVTQPADARLTVNFSSERVLYWDLFSLACDEARLGIARLWGLPISDIQVRYDQFLPLQSVSVDVEGGDTVLMEVEPRESSAVLLALPRILDREGNPIDPDPVLAFFERFRADWEAFHPNDNPDVTWWIVPRWSLPIWKAAGQPASSGHTLTAVSVFNHLLDHPEALATEHATEFLLRRAAKEYPQTVREAMLARGERLDDDLAAITRNDKEVLLLPDILDVLAEHWMDTPAEIGRLIAEQGVYHRLIEDPISDVEVPRLPTTLHGPWATPPQSEQKDFGVYRDVESALPAVEPLVRIYVGTQLETEWITWFPWGTTPSVSAALERIRESLHLRYGMDMPEIEFRRPRTPETLGPRAFRIEMITERYGAGPDAIQVPEGEDSAAVLESELDAAYTFLRGHWISAEWVFNLFPQMPVGLGEWLRKTYSLTDLKILLRGVIAPGAMPDVELPLGAEDTVAFAPWLLRSLRFWVEIEDAKDAPALVTRLRATQRARLSAEAAPPMLAAIGGDMRQGMDALASGRLEDARLAFQKAIARDQGAAVSAFVSHWPGYLVPCLANDIQTSLGFVYLDPAQRIELAHLIETESATAADADRRRMLRRLRLLLISDESYVTSEVHDKRKARFERELLAERVPAIEWAPEDARWFAIRVLRKHDPLQGDDERLRRASALLRSAIVRLEAEQAHDAFYELVGIATGSGTANWAWALLDELASIRQDAVDRNLPLALALNFCTAERRDRLERALELADVFEANLNQAGLDADDRSWHDGWIRYVRAYAYHGLARAGDQTMWARSLELCKTLFDFPRDGIAQTAIQQAFTNAQCLGLREEAERYRELYVSRWPADRVLVVTNRMTDYMDDGNAARLESAARFAAEKDDDPSYVGTWRWAAAIGALMSRFDGWQDVVEDFLTSTEFTHEYRDYALMIYVGAEGPEGTRARELLRERWEGLRGVTRYNADLIDRRMQAGDVLAWRELLLAAFVGEADLDAVLDTIDDEAKWRASPLFGLPVSRAGLQSEGWYYAAELAASRGDLARMRECFQKCIDAGVRTYWEDSMARYQLARPR